jgi:hypothetical protein
MVLEKLSKRGWVGETLFWRRDKQISRIAYSNQICLTNVCEMLKKLFFLNLDKN